VLAVDDVSDAPDRHTERQGDGDGVEVAQRQARAPDVHGDGDRGQDEAAVERESAGAQPFCGFVEQPVLHDVEHTSADQAPGRGQEGDGDRRLAR
jgi:hypothetical protein